MFDLSRLRPKRDSNENLAFCVGCPDHEACVQGACYLNGGPLEPGPVDDFRILGFINGKPMYKRDFEQELTYDSEA